MGTPEPTQETAEVLLTQEVGAAYIGIHRKGDMFVIVVRDNDGRTEAVAQIDLPAAEFTRLMTQALRLLG
jgi:hypothetical protein